MTDNVHFRSWRLSSLKIHGSLRFFAALQYIYQFKAVGRLANWYRPLMQLIH